MVRAGMLEKGPSEESPTAGQILKGDLILFPGETCRKKLLTGGLGNGLCPVLERWVLILCPLVHFTGLVTHVVLALWSVPLYTVSLLHVNLQAADFQRLECVFACPIM